MDPLVPVDSCPLCGGARREEHSVPPANLYSEMLASIVAMDERSLLKRVRNVQCGQCGLIHKDHWLRPEALRRLFLERVPSHPRGWDVVSGRFSPDNFQVEVTAYGRAIETRDDPEIRRYRRSLASILDSVPDLEGTPECDRLNRAIETGDVAALRAADARLRDLMREPTPYKRFSGFSATVLWSSVASRLGGLRRYAEVGCPLWGLLPRAVEHGCAATYLDRPEANYWSTGCRQDGMHCTERLAATTPVGTARWQDVNGRSFDAIGAFQYLDHLERPGEFMDELFARARAAVLILDAVDRAVALQHFTGWTSPAIAWLADRHRCRVYDDFDGIRASGNFLVLLEQA
jgi:hypothetical protein